MEVVVIKLQQPLCNFCKDIMFCYIVYMLVICNKYFKSESKIKVFRRQSD